VGGHSNKYPSCTKPRPLCATYNSLTMKANFKIKGFRDIEFQGKLIDLHNSYDLQSFEYNINTKTLILFWTKSVEVWGSTADYEKITLTHIGVNYLHASFSPSIQFPKDNQCLSEVTFYPANERLENSFFLEQEESKDGDDIIYSFISDQVIRVGCDEVLLVV